MKPYVVIHKVVGETPLMALARFKDANPIYKGMTACYAGRLDPMAEGKLLFLFGDECKKLKKYTGLDKEYEIEVLLGVGSDTGDALGLTKASARPQPIKGIALRTALKKEVGVHMRPYPVFSSKTVNGAPLFLHALRGTLSQIEVPVHEEHIYQIRHTRTNTISKSELQVRIEDFLKKVPLSTEPSKELGADFRIKEVRASWDRVFQNAPEMFTILTLRVSCGSGTYMRSLAGRIGEALGTSALALSISRTKIGKYWGGVWWRSFS